MIIDHTIGDRVYAVIPHFSGALVVVGTLASIHIEADFNTAVLVTPAGEEQCVPLGAVRALTFRNGEPAMWTMEEAVIRIVGALLAPPPTAPPLADPGPAPPPMDDPALPVEF